MKRDEAVIGAILFLFGGITSVLSLGMPIGNFRMAGTGLFPLCLGILLMVLAGLFLLKLFYEERKRTEKKVNLRYPGPETFGKLMAIDDEFYSKLVKETKK